MKKVRQITAAFLAVTFLVMTLIPCADACDNTSHQTEHHLQSAQEHHQELNDICSPFCSCSCCSTAITILHFPSFSIMPEFSVKDFPILYQSFSSLEHSSIWQPPKIS